MKITGMNVYQVDLPLKEGRYSRSNGNFVEVFDSTVLDVINLRISGMGGLTKARQMRDLCVTHRIPMSIEDTWGGDITAAAIAHPARPTPPKFTFSATDFNSYGTVDIAMAAPKSVNDRMTAQDRPGQGINLIYDALGEPVAQYN